VNRIIATLTLLIAAVFAARSTAQTVAIDTLIIKAHTHFLAHDLLAGRATGSLGNRLAALYIENQCRALGLTPIDEQYDLPVPLEEAEVLPSTQLALKSSRGSVQFLYPLDFTPNVGTQHTLRGFAGPTVFVGTEGDVLKGRADHLEILEKIAVTVGPFRGAAADTLAARGALGMVHLIGTAEGFDLYLRSRGSTRLYHRDPEVPSSFLPGLPSVLGGPRLARALLAGATVGEDQDVAPQPLPWTLWYEPAFKRAPVDEANVGCVLRGTDADARDTAIVLTAHYDHLGISLPDARGDSIYNGFSDNAVGVAMLLAIADAVGRRADTRLRHSLVFLFLTGEERGLLGADYYAANPAWPLDRTVAAINLDAGAPPAPPVSWRIAGVDSTGLGSLAFAIARRQGWKVTTSPARPNSDYYPFHREGVPAAFVIPGPGPYEGLSADSSKALRARWDHYHQPSDHWEEVFPFSGLARYAQFALLLIREIDGTGLR
jgi:hypothetical protein